MRGGGAVDIVWRRPARLLCCRDAGFPCLGVRGRRTDVIARLVKRAKLMPATNAAPRRVREVRPCTHAALARERRRSASPRALADEKATSSMAAATAQKAFSSLVGLQVVTRALNFALTAALARQLGPALQW